MCIAYLVNIEIYISDLFIETRGVLSTDNKIRKFMSDEKGEKEGDRYIQIDKQRKR